MNIQFGIEILSSYKRLSYTPWHALAEFVDNSTQAYFDHKNTLDALFLVSGDSLTVRIELGADSNGDYLRITDNSFGMSKSVLEHAVIIGRPPLDTSGRNRYGLGMKTAACWFGDYWTIRTKTLDETVEHFIEVDVERIVSGDQDLKYEEIDGKGPSEHYTILEIRRLHRYLNASRTSGKIRDFLTSMYRFDTEKNGLKLFWKDQQLKWDSSLVKSRLLKRIDGSLEMEEFEFKVGDKTVKGWAGVFEKGSRRDAGFSVIQADRVIEGWPKSFRPSTIFGPQEGGSNDLVNQRLVGELVMDGFVVSHTKDEILYSNDELDELESKLLEKCERLRKLALSYRKYEVDEREPSTEDNLYALTEFESELKSNEMRDYLQNVEVPDIDIVKVSNQIVLDNVTKRVPPSIKVNLGAVEVLLYVVADMSPYEPYVIIESTKSKSRVVVIVNKAHPHWKALTNKDSVLNFLRHCTYDGVAEWKAYSKLGKIEPETIKSLKDGLLRIPFEIIK